MNKKKKGLFPIRCVKHMEINLYEPNSACTISATGR